MVTAIRIDTICRQRLLFLAGTLAFLPATCKAEQEIYVTTGPDGVEIFSNLPRRPVASWEAPAMAANGRAVIHSRQSVQSVGPVTDEAATGSENEASGKSFLLDD